MRAMIVDKRAPAFALLGYIEAQPGMTTTAGNEIKSVNGQSCQVQIDGRLYKKTEVCIDIETARSFGWEPPPEVQPKPSKRARNALARNAGTTKPPGRTKPARQTKGRST